MIPGSTAVLLLGLASVWAEHLDITASGNRWALAALVLYLSIVPFIPLVFIRKLGTRGTGWVIPPRT